MAADLRGCTRMKTEQDKIWLTIFRKFLSASIRVHPRLILVLALCLCASVAIVLSSSRAQQKPKPVPPLEGCLKCHDQIEPMHRYGPTVAGALDKLDNGKDGIGLTCTACHGGNPVATTKEEAHVQPRFPKEWMRGGKFRVPESSAPRTT